MALPALTWEHRDGKKRAIDARWTTVHRGPPGPPRLAPCCNTVQVSPIHTAFSPRRDEPWPCRGSTWMNRGAPGTGVDRWGTGGDASPPPTFQLGGDHIGNVPPPTFLLKKWKISCVLSPSNLHSLSACVIDTGVYK